MNRTLRRAAPRVLPLIPLLTLLGCGGGDGTPAAPAPITIADASTRCAALASYTVAASAIGLPTLGARVTSAALQAADTANNRPEFCKVLGSVDASDSASPPINFEVNLPTVWNTKAVQFGGGGFNGSVVTGLGNLPGTASATVVPATPISKGYVTFGGDSGHTGGNGAFGLNATALANYSGESVKRTHDAALAAVLQYYQSAPSKMYHVGGSKGGHEGLIAAQRYGADYDGVIAYYPANQNQAMVLTWYDMWKAAYLAPGGYLNPAKQQLLQDGVLAACDALDGVADGLVSNRAACDATFSVNSLRCVGGADTGDTCLSNAQIATLMSGVNPMVFDFPLANGITTLGPLPVFHGGDLSPWLESAGVGTATAYYGFSAGVIPYFVRQAASTTIEPFDYRDYQARVTQISQLYDATDPNVDAFKAKGGKLIIVQGTIDMLVPESTTIKYHATLAAKYGDALKSFVKFYTQPGYGHGAGKFNVSWDSLSALEGWAEKGQAPSNPVAVDGNTATKDRSRPLCEYPLWPKYGGSGDVNSAASYTCASS